jgi:hypothetical protein
MLVICRVIGLPKRDLQDAALPGEVGHAGEKPAEQGIIAEG